MILLNLENIDKLSKTTNFLTRIELILETLASDLVNVLQYYQDLFRFLRFECFQQNRQRSFRLENYKMAKIPSKNFDD